MPAGRRLGAVGDPTVQVDQGGAQQGDVVNRVVGMHTGRAVRPLALHQFGSAGEMLSAGEEVMPGFAGGFQIHADYGINLGQAAVAAPVFGG